MPTQTKLNGNTFEALLESATENVQSDNRNNFRAICLSSNLPIAEIADLFSGSFDIEQKGEFYHLSTSYSKYRHEFDVDLYLYRHEQTGTPILFTLNSSEDVRRTIGSTITHTEGIYHLWLPPDEMNAISDVLLETEGCRLMKFTGKKFGRETQNKGERRPEYVRRQEYEGKDAAQTLEEAKFEYGITPTKLEFEIPTRADFTLNNDGEFVLKGGNATFFVEEIVINESAERVADMNREVQSSKFNVIEEDGLEVFDKKSLEIGLGNELEYKDADDILEKMQKMEFYPYNTSVEEGSLLLTSRLIDEENGGMLSIATDGSELLILPKHGSSFASVLKFYRFIVENVDASADIVNNEQ